MQHYIYIIGVAITWILIALAVIHVVMDNRQPSKTMAWALVILFVPLVGIVFYLFFGLNHRRQRLVSQRSLDQLSRRSMLNFVEQQELHVPESHRLLVDLFINQYATEQWRKTALRRALQSTGKRKPKQATKELKGHGKLAIMIQTKH